jgi:hypothetical protein
MKKQRRRKRGKRRKKEKEDDPKCSELKFEMKFGQMNLLTVVISVQYHTNLQET